MSSSEDILPWNYIDLKLAVSDRVDLMKFPRLNTVKPENKSMSGTVFSRAYFRESLHNGGNNYVDKFKSGVNIS